MADRSITFPVSVIVVTYNSAHCVERALVSAAVAAELIVIDNASADASVAAANRHQCRVITNDGNRGFSVACNQGARIATSEYLLFLNPDAVLAPDSIAQLLDAAAKNPAAVAIGPRLELPDGDDVDSSHEKRLNRARDRTIVQDRFETLAGAKTVTSLSGAALLCRASTFAEVGGFDEQFFLYFEDEDLCRRLSKLGSLIRCDDAVVYHLPGSGTRLDAQQHFFKYRSYGRSRAYFARKHGLRFASIPAAFEQLGKALLAVTRADNPLAAQHLGRAVGYFEGRFARLQ